jgi:cytochrome c
MRLSSSRGTTLTVVLATCALVALLAACGVAQHSGQQAVGGNASTGKQDLARYACGSCHTIPGVANAKGLIGPPLNNIGSRRIIAGKLPNTPDQMELWLRDPQSVWPGNAMPNEGVTDQEARDMAAYLFSLK